MTTAEVSPFPMGMLALMFMKHNALHGCVWEWGTSIKRTHFFMGKNMINRRIWWLPYFQTKPLSIRCLVIKQWQLANDTVFFPHFIFELFLGSPFELSRGFSGHRISTLESCDQLNMLTIPTNQVRSLNTFKYHGFADIKIMRLVMFFWCFLKMARGWA
jgi:hypothetical protein